MLAHDGDVGAGRPLMTVSLLRSNLRPVPAGGPIGLSGDVLLLAETGQALRLGDLARKPQPILSPSGWMMPEIRPLGLGPAVLVTFAPGRPGRGGSHLRSRSGHRVHAVCSPGHAWPLLDGTFALVGGGEAVLAAASPPSPADAHFDLGFVHGLVFGDGWRAGSSSAGMRRFQIQLCGDKAIHHGHRFPRLSWPPSRAGDAVASIWSEIDLKALPGEADPAYLAGFVGGWIAADGCEVVGGHVLTTTDQGAVEWLVRHAALAGRYVTGHAADASSITNYGRRRAQLHRLRVRDSLHCWIVETVQPFVGEAELFQVEGLVVMAGGVVAGRDLHAVDQYNIIGMNLDMGPLTRGDLPRPNTACDKKA